MFPRAFSVAAVAVFAALSLLAVGFVLPTDDPTAAADTARTIDVDDRFSASSAAASIADAQVSSDPLEGLTVTRADDPARSIVEDADGNWVATFTDGAYTVTLAGPSRTFDEPTATHGVTTDRWVRILDEPFDGEVDGHWLGETRADVSPDVLEVATQYFEDAPDVLDDDGELISAAAEYGPLQPDGYRPVGSDWHDFRGIDAVYDGKVDPADPEEYRSLDCSGYVRIVYGFRFGIPMSLRPVDGTTLPRRSFEQAADAPGVAPIPETGSRPTDLTSLEAGDLVFFDAPSDNDGRIDHVGIYLGVDDGGQHRFIHSRRSHNGPTMGGDSVSASVLSGDGFYARGFRSSRRL